MLKKILLLAIAVFAAVSAKAEDDALCTWTTVAFDKSIGKWSVGLASEYRHKIHEGVSKTDQYFARPRVAYKALPWLTLRYQMDFAATSSGFTMRFLPEVTMSKKLGDFTIAYRQRTQTTWKTEQGTNSTVLRSRAKFDYSIPKTPLSVHFAFEPYWCDFSKTSFAWFQKARWYAGFNIKLLDNLTLTPQYLCQSYFNHQGKYDRRTYDDHVIYITFSVKL